MPRRMRIDFPGAIHPVMSRGDRRENIYLDDVDRQDFLKTLAEACQKTDWQVHAYCLMRNHFHLVVETPNANRVDGMHWLLSTYTIRLNRRHETPGHVFSGRYKALVVESDEGGYLKTACDYVHLNPVPAHLLGTQDRLLSYPWSSLGWYLAAKEHRPGWMRVDRLMGEHGIHHDTAAGRMEFEGRMEARRMQEEDEEQLKPLRRGWCLGSPEFRERMLEQMEQRAGENPNAEVRRESATAKADMPSGRHSFAVAVANGKICVVGGGTCPSATAPVHEYDPISNTWATKASIPTTRGTPAAVNINGKVVVLGGVVSAGVPAATEQYDPVTDKWTSRGFMPTIRNECYATIIGSKLYVFGGYDEWSMEALSLPLGSTLTDPQNPRIATATAQVVNGFVVGATITDGGSGFTNNPAVSITGDGGSGATATATVSSGSVTSINIITTGSGYTSTPTITIAPPPLPPRRATVANGVVTGINVINSGTGYTSTPRVSIASPPFSPELSIRVTTVEVIMKVVLGRKYQLESSIDLKTWTPTGDAFVALEEERVQEFDVDTTGRYFHINQVP